jgi:exodeoxyribonuclease VII large subunit
MSAEHPIPDARPRASTRSTRPERVEGRPPFDPSRVTADRASPPESVAFRQAQAAKAAPGSRPLTVSEVNRLIKDTLETAFPSLWVVGEVSNLRRPRSGHVYLTLKDDRAQLRAVLWRGVADRLRFQLTDGLAVLARGSITVYSPRGEYQLVIERLEPRGIGALELAFQQLKEKLQREGLFDPARKRPLPPFPSHVAVVTSPTGAALHDILTVIRRRFPPLRVTLYPVRVQGEGAAQEIATAIADLNRLGGFDVMIVGRGGGSLEDLWAFNEEVVARAIAASRIPVVSAVGHEIDVTISDLVADRRALTPTEAAELVTPRLDQLLTRLDALRQQLAQTLRHLLTALSGRLREAGVRLRPTRLLDLLRLKEQYLDDLAGRSARSIARRAERARDRLLRAGVRLQGLSPLAVLGRGYSVTREPATGRLLVDAAAVTTGTSIESILAHGLLRSRVEEVRPKHPFEDLAAGQVSGSPEAPEPAGLEKTTDPAGACEAGAETCGEG